MTDDDLEPLHQLEAILPEYDHSVCSFEPVEGGGFSASLKLHARAEQEVKQWLEDFQTSSKTTWRILKTYPSNDTSKRNNKYRVDLRCQLGGRFSKTPTQKKTFCPALLYLILKKDTFSQKRKSRSSDPHIQHNLNFHIILRSTHNHEINCPESLQYRSVSKETIEKLEKLFAKGHSPSSALKALKNELRAQMGDGFEAAAADYALCPHVSFCFRLYYKIYPHKKRQRKKRSIQAKATFNSPTETEIDSPDEAFEPLSALELQEDCISPAPPQDCSFFTVMDFSSVQTEALCQSSDTEIRLRGMFEDLLQKMKTDETLEEPVKAMLCSYETMSNDTNKLISALNSFGKMRKHRN